MKAKNGGKIDDFIYVGNEYPFRYNRNAIIGFDPVLLRFSDEITEYPGIGFRLFDFFLFVSIRTTRIW